MTCDMNVFIIVKICTYMYNSYIHIYNMYVYMYMMLMGTYVHVFIHIIKNHVLILTQISQVLSILEIQMTLLMNQLLYNGMQWMLFSLSLTM